MPHNHILLFLYVYIYIVYMGGSYMNNINKLMTIKHIMLSLYVQIRYPQTNVNITLQQPSIDHWLHTHIPFDYISSDIFILPEPFTTRLSFDDDDILFNSYTIINKYLKSTSFNYNDLYNNFIQVNISPISDYFSLTLYEIIQLIDINKRIL